MEPGTPTDTQMPFELDDASDYCLRYYYELAAHAIRSVSRRSGDVGASDENAKEEKILLRTESQVAPHGGELIDRVVPEDERRERSIEAAGLPRVSLGPRTLSDLQMISTGVFSPLEGF